MPDEEKEIYYKLNAKQNELVEAEWKDKNKPIIVAENSQLSQYDWKADHHELL